MTIQIKHISANLSLVILSIFISIVVAEVLLRNIYQIGVSTSFDHRIPHPVFGWVLEPDSSYLNKMPEETVQVTYNSMGWCDVEHTIENSHDVFRLLVIGDSFMEAYSVELEDAFHMQIEQLARKEGVNIEVINMGVGGYGTLQEYLVFRNIGKQYKPDTVLLGFFIGNDIRNNSFSLESIMFSNNMRVKSRPFLDASDETTWRINQVDYDGAWHRYLKAKAKRDSFRQRMIDQFALLQAMQQAWRHNRKTIKNTDRPAGDRDDETKKKAKTLAKFGVNYCQEHPEYTNAWITTKRILGRLKSEISKIGGELVVFTVPAIHEVIEERIADVTDRGLVCFEDAPAYDRLESIVKELDIEYIDLLPDFRKSMRDDKQNNFRRSDRHWNDKGHHLAATIVYSALRDREILPVVKTSQFSQPLVAVPGSTDYRK